MHLIFNSFAFANLIVVCLILQHGPAFQQPAAILISSSILFWIGAYVESMEKRQSTVVRRIWEHSE